MPLNKQTKPKNFRAFNIYIYEGDEKEGEVSASYDPSLFQFLIYLFPPQLNF